MEDREKRVIEMAKAMCFHTDSCTVGAEDCCCELNCETTWLAEKLVDLNYQKVGPEDIVISKKEYEKEYEDYQDLLKNFDNYLFEYRKFADGCIKDKVKYTAQEFYNLSEEYGAGVMFYRKVRQLAKQLGVEVKE